MTAIISDRATPRSARSQLKKRGIRPQFPKRVYKAKKNRGRPIKNDTPRFRTAKDVFPGFKENIDV